MTLLQHDPDDKELRGLVESAMHWRDECIAWAKLTPGKLPAHPFFQAMFEAETQCLEALKRIKSVGDDRNFREAVERDRREMRHG